MDMTKHSSRGRKSNLIVQTWNRCKFLGRGGKDSPRLVRSLSAKSKSWPRAMVSPSSAGQLTLESPPPRRRRAPHGCFSIYVGPEKQRFVLKTEYINHPLFKMLLEEAESEYGYNPEGPLALPCNVDVFYEVLVAMDDNNDYGVSPRRGCGGFARNGYGSPRRGCAGFARNGNGSYRLLTQLDWSP